MKESPNVHSERIITDLLSNKYFRNKAIQDSSSMVKDNCYAQVAANLLVFCDFLSGIDDQPVHVHDELASLADKFDVQNQSLCGTAEEIYLDRDSTALQAAFRFRDRFFKDINLSNETSRLIRDVS